MTALGSRLAQLWCKAMHPAPMWPVNGHYYCPACLRTYPVPWERRQAPVAVAAVSNPGNAAVAAAGTR